MVEADSILILAVMHCHREPTYWLQRIGKTQAQVQERSATE
jgi:hypothetical protein